jgi:starch phosphorylase
VVFVPDYGVSMAELLVPAAELSEQISTAGTEASGTGNMKLALNGALTIGTLDGANIEMLEAVGAGNLFAFGLTADDVARRRAAGYDPRAIYLANDELRQAVDMIGGGFFSPDSPGAFRPLVDSLLACDHYLLFADYADFVSCQDEVDAAYRSRDEWNRRAILNVAGMGRFSSDRTIREYADKVWRVAPVRVEEREPA